MFKKISCILPLVIFLFNQSALAANDEFLKAFEKHRQFQRQIESAPVGNYQDFIIDLSDQIDSAYKDYKSDPYDHEKRLLLDKLFDKFIIATVYGINIDNQSDNNDTVKSKFSHTEEPTPINDIRIEKILHCLHVMSKHFLSDLKIRKINLQDFSYLELYDNMSDHLLGKLNSYTLRKLGLKESTFSYSQRLMMFQILLVFQENYLKAQHPEESERIAENFRQMTDAKIQKDMRDYDYRDVPKLDTLWQSSKSAVDIVRNHIERVYKPVPIKIESFNPTTVMDLLDQDKNNVRQLSNSVQNKTDRLSLNSWAIDPLKNLKIEKNDLHKHLPELIDIVYAGKSPNPELISWMKYLPHSLQTEYDLKELNLNSYERLDLFKRSKLLYFLKNLIIYYIDLENYYTLDPAQQEEAAGNFAFLIKNLQDKLYKEALKMAILNYVPPHTLMKRWYY